jgi:ketosteroid isomerase-like protein
MAQMDVARVARDVFDAWNAHDVERYAALVDENCPWESDTL